MENTVTTTYLDRSYCRTHSGYPRMSFLCCNRTALPRIEQATPSLSWSGRRPTSYLRHRGRRIRQTFIQSSTVRVWSDLQEKVYRSKIVDVDDRKTRLIDEWAQFDQSIVDAAISQSRHRLNAVSVYAGHISSINSDNRTVIRTYNFAKYFSLLCAN